MTDHYAAAQAAGEARLELLERLLMGECDGLEVEWPADMVAPYDGCTTCQVREVLVAALPHLRAIAAEETPV